MTTFTGRDGIATYRAIALKHGIVLYAKCRMKPNRLWTPTAMLRAAGGITGETYKRGQYDRAIAGLDAWIAANGTTGEAR
jgi:hypothetical protein